ncbi:hypothetical protein [Streptomyces sp.]|uniref:hypothetical protein n=1 Tax=Streptomyces sp. TaxID=1931 RepID=UPI002811D7D1|nr:hypothetical protein [Streptomyces sp.]
MIWRTGRLVCLALIGAEFWALLVGERQLLNLFAVLALGVLAVAWVLTPKETEEGDR